MAGALTFVKANTSTKRDHEKYSRTVGYVSVADEV